jgi:hypothetical protein
VGLRAGLDDVEKRKFLTLSGLELRPLVRPARSKSLYRLSFPGSLFNIIHSKRKHICNMAVVVYLFKRQIKSEAYDVYGTGNKAF